MCGGECGPIGKFKQTIIGNTHGGQKILKKLSSGGGVATNGGEQHSFRTTVLVVKWVGHHWENQNKPSLATHKGDEISEKRLSLGGLGRRRFGLSNTLFVLLCSGLNGWDTIGTPKQTIISNTHGGTKVPKQIIGRVGLATNGVEQHAFRTTVLGFEWVGHHWENQNKPLLATHKGDEISEKRLSLGGLGRRRFGLSNTLFVVL